MIVFPQALKRDVIFTISMTVTNEIILKRGFPRLESLARSPDSEWHRFISRTAEINPSLTSQEYRVLFTAASPTYQNGVEKGVSILLDMPQRQVSYTLEKVFYKLGVYDVFSAVYNALENGILNIEEMPSKRIEDIASRLSTLNRSEGLILDAMAELAMRYGEIDYKSVSAILPLRVRTIKHYIGTIKSKLRLDNLAQVAVATYIRKNPNLNNTESAQTFVS